MTATQTIEEIIVKYDYSKISRTHPCWIWHIYWYQENTSQIWAVGRKTAWGARVIMACTIIRITPKQILDLKILEHFHLNSNIKASVRPSLSFKISKSYPLLCKFCKTFLISSTAWIKKVPVAVESFSLI